MMWRGWTAGVGAFVAAGTLSAAAQDKPDTEEQIRSVTVIGCVELEKDYRARMSAGRGGVLGTGIGAGNEFVLTNARPASTEGASTTAPPGGTNAARPAGTAGADSAKPDAPVASRGRETVPGSRPGTDAAAGLSGDYSLTGELEGELVRQVGRMVEVVGTVEDIEAHESAKDAKELPELTVQTWHTRADVCPPGSVTGPARETGNTPAGARPADSNPEGTPREREQQ